MSVLPQASLFLGIIPALFIMYLALKDYDKYYEEKKVFITFIIGIIIGFVTSFVQYGLIKIVIYGVLPTAFIFIISFSLLDQLSKTIILNLRRFQQKRETPIYGMSLGLGFGSSFTPIMLIIASASISISNDTYVLGLIALGSIGLILFHAAAGIYIGYGIYDNNLRKNLSFAVIFQIPLSFMVGLMLNYSHSDSITYQLILSFSIIVYGFILFFYTTKKVLPNILKKEKIRR